jgi:hypothetical protein
MLLTTRILCINRIQTDTSTCHTRLPTQNWLAWAEVELREDLRWLVVVRIRSVLLVDKVR